MESLSEEEGVEKKRMEILEMKNAMSEVKKLNQ